MSSSTEAKIELKKQLLGVNGKPVKDGTNLKQLIMRNPGLMVEEITKQLPDILIGHKLQALLLSVPAKDTNEQVKLYRWTQKIETKMQTDKGHMSIDLNQLQELLEYLSKIKDAATQDIAPIIILLEKLREKLEK